MSLPRILENLAQASSKNRLFRKLALASRDVKRRLSLRQLDDINSYEKRIYSQNGEDGIIAELFSRIPHSRYFVEIGVEDGLQCNTALLARHYGWRGLMIEADDSVFDRLKANYADLPVNCIHSLVDRDNVGETLRTIGVPLRFDLLSIDVDGNDYYIWEATAPFAPSVVVIEYNASLGRDASTTIPYDPKREWRRDRYFGASLGALAKLGGRLGYSLVGTNRRGVNAFFVRRDLMALCGFPEKSPREAWHPPMLAARLLPAGSGTFVEV